MRNLTLLYTSLSVISSLVFSPAQASKKLNNEDISQTLKTQVIQNPDDRLYQEALNYQAGKVAGFPKDAPHTLEKAKI